jgi:TolA-binding protein
LYETGVALAKQRRTDEAVRIFTYLAISARDPELKERAFYKRAETYWSGGRYLEGHHAYASFVTRYPESPRAAKAKERAMWCALQLARIGEPGTIVTRIFSGSGRNKGVELLRAFLGRYPREECSAEYRFRLGTLLMEQENNAEAAGEFALLVQEYPGSRQAGPALLRLAELQLRAFKGLPYDIKSLREAKRHYLRFIEEYGGLDEQLTAHARGEIARIDGLLAGKLRLVADYYDRWGHPDAASLYRETIRKRFPGAGGTEPAETPLPAADEK